MANKKVCSFSNKKRIRGQYKKISSLCMCMRIYIYTYIPPKGRKDIKRKSIRRWQDKEEIERHQ